MLVSFELQYVACLPGSAFHCRVDVDPDLTGKAYC